ncbi:MAG: phosphopantothenoylcysteine decarboxylase, partial [Muribaculaceae bacterium]|nr:phosphopantothenoylcysteine decarboxylase [Muribaculaceae bacterium]
DYTPETVSETKIKREQEDSMALRLKRNPDIAASLGREKGDRVLVGFALETDHETENALHKLRKKNLDWIVLNSLRDAEAGFMKDTNKVTIIGKDGSTSSFPAKSKREVAADIVEAVLPSLKSQE